MILPIEITATE